MFGLLHRVSYHKSSFVPDLLLRKGRKVTVTSDTAITSEEFTGLVRNHSRLDVDLMPYSSDQCIVVDPSLTTKGKEVRVPYNHLREPQVLGERDLPLSQALYLDTSEKKNHCFNLEFFPKVAGLTPEGRMKIESVIKEAAGLHTSIIRASTRKFGRVCMTERLGPKKNSSRVSLPVSPISPNDTGSGLGLTWSERSELCGDPPRYELAIHADPNMLPSPTISPLTDDARTNRDDVGASPPERHELGETTTTRFLSADAIGLPSCQSMNELVQFSSPPYSPDGVAQDYARREWLDAQPNCYLLSEGLSFRDSRA